MTTSGNKKQTKIHSIPVKRPNSDAQKSLINYQWPGNIRELENAIEYALTMATGDELTVEDFPMQDMAWNSPPTVSAELPEGPGMAPKEASPTLPSLKILKKEKMEKERDKIFEALRLHEGSRTLAAKELGISKSTLWRKIKKHQLDQ